MAVRRGGGGGGLRGNLLSTLLLLRIHARRRTVGRGPQDGRLGSRHDGRGGGSGLGRLGS